ncbi:MAG: aspartyl protease family protein [Cyclobacteriaceae bacterium]|nr:aspartyl protease family protein [Cyclobacteriaceae bacterium]MDH5248294.1 aspartyl protease family protein [Cyclobacteriaceae bacterium]
MKILLTTALFQLLFQVLNASPTTIMKAGFSLPDSLAEVTIRYKSMCNLILLPVTINDTTHVNLILDTGCRNLVLFGRRFNKFFNMEPDKSIQFSGLGSGKPLAGRLSLGNKVSIDAVIGRKIPVVVVPNQNLFGSYLNVDGVIGYDIFIKFEVELDLARQRITFRPPFTSELSSDYEKINIRVEDSLPIINSTIFFQGSEGQSRDLIIDTGSSLGLLVETSDLEKYPKETRGFVIGRGLNGDITGIEIMAEKILLDHFEINTISAGVIYSGFRNNASIGMGILNDFTIVFNYCKEYVGLRRTA